MPRCFFVLIQLLNIPLHGARRAMAAACRCPTRGNGYIFPRYTHSYPQTSLRSHSGSVPKISFSPYPLTKRKKENEQRKKKATPAPPDPEKQAKPLLLHSLPPWLGSLLDLQLAGCPAVQLASATMGPTSSPAGAFYVRGVCPERA